MPRSTLEYPFELKMAGLFIEDNCTQPALYILKNGEFKSQEVDLKLIDKLRISDEVYYFKDPLDDGREYCWLEWQNMSKDLIGIHFDITFEEQDFISFRNGVKKPFPHKWSVMLG